MGKFWSRQLHLRLLSVFYVAVAPLRLVHLVMLNFIVL